MAGNGDLVKFTITHSMEFQNKKAKGGFGERVAARHLKQRGCEIIDTNYFLSGGELDIVAKKNGTYIIAEVKTRFNNILVDPITSVSRKKYLHLLSLAHRYFAEKGIATKEFQIDIIGITIISNKKPMITHLEDVRGVLW